MIADVANDDWKLRGLDIAGDIAVQTVVAVLAAVGFFICQNHGRRRLINAITALEYLHNLLFLQPSLTHSSLGSRAKYRRKMSETAWEGKKQLSRKK